jgi:hypothetical protein
LYGLAGLLYTLNLLKEFFPHKRDVIDQKINIIADRIIRQNEGNEAVKRYWLMITKVTDKISPLVPVSLQLFSAV